MGLSDSIGIDNTVNRNLKSPILRLDLTQEHSMELILRMMQQGTLCYIHMGPPCGTASRARHIKRRAYRYTPPLCRSDQCPDGLASLKGSLKTRVNLANKLYEVASFVFKEAWDRGIFCSVENPGRSYFWLTSHWNKYTSQLPYFTTFFHHCCFGSKRRKLTRLSHIFAVWRHFAQANQIRISTYLGG